MRKKQLKRELAKETRFRPAGQAPVEQGFHCQSNSRAYNAVSLTRPAVVLAHESLGACPRQMSRNVERSEYAASRTSPDTHRLRALNSRQWTVLFPERVRDTVAKKPRRICQKIRQSDAFTHSSRSLCKSLLAAAISLRLIVAITALLSFVADPPDRL